MQKLKLILFLLAPCFLLLYPSFANARLQFWPVGIEIQASPGIITSPDELGYPYMFKTADFNSDGNDDLIFLHYQSDHHGGPESTSIDVLLCNDDPGGFKIPAISTEISGDTEISVATWELAVSSLLLGDFNNDGKMDAAIIQFITDVGKVVFIYTGNGDGTFNAPDPMSDYTRVENFVPPEYTNDVILKPSTADFNSDGNLDLAASVTWQDENEDYHGYISVLPGNGNGTFNFNSLVVSDDFGVNIEGLVAADFNGDNKPDLFFTNASAHILLGNGDGTFTAHATIDDMGSSLPVAADFNNDGNKDMAALSGDDLVMSLGNGDGTFSVAKRYENEAGTTSTSLVAADFNSDGYMDAAITNSTERSLSLFIWDNSIKDFGSPVTIEIGAYHPLLSPVWFADPYEIVTSDFNHDGFADLAATSLDYGTISILFGDGAGDFVKAPMIDAENLGSASCMVLKDFNGDGLGDIASVSSDKTKDENTGEYVFTNNYVNLYFGDGSGNFTATGQYPVGAAPNVLLAEDFNNDGATDLATGNMADNSVTILLGDGNGNFSQPAQSPFAVGDFPADIAAGDFNNDGNIDLAGVSIEYEFILGESAIDFDISKKGSCSIFLGDGTGAFTPASGSPFETEVAPTDLTVSDFNNDGYDDIAIINTSECTFSVYMSNGDGTFADPDIYDGACTGPLVPEELEDSGIWQLFGFLSNNKLFKIFSGDFDDDGFSDIIIADATTLRLWFFWGDGTGNFEPAPNYSSIGYGAKDPMCSFAAPLQLPLHFGSADLDNDGALDLVATNGIVGNVFLVSLDKASGMVATKIAYKVGGGIPVEFIFGDIDGDANIDILTWNVQLTSDGFKYQNSVLFNNSPARLDFGDAPAPYPTLLADDGARHKFLFGNYLGNSLDFELDGVPASDAMGDDNTDNDDEDGVTFDTLIIEGQTMGITVTASKAGMLDAWIDFNGDGDWGDAGENVFVSQDLTAGANVLNIAVPVDADTTNPTFARFRFSSAGGLSYTGLADDGETEDYAITILADSNGDGIPDTDTDGDGLIDSTEAQVPNADGLGNGDGNGDGTQDREQAAVSSLMTVNGDQWITVTNTSGCVQNPVVAVAPPNDPPPGVEFPYGFFQFTLTCNECESGDESIEMILYFPYDRTISGYWKKDNNDNWQNIAEEIGHIGNEKTWVRIVLADNGIFDENMENCVLTDDSGPGRYNHMAIPTITEWGMIILSIVLAGAALWMMRRHQIS